MLHLTCGTSFLLLFVFFISLMHHHHPALLCHHPLTLDWLLTFLVVFSSLVLKPSFSQSLSIQPSMIYPLLTLISWNLTTRCLAVVVVLVNAAG